MHKQIRLGLSRTRFLLAGAVGLEPTTYGFGDQKRPLFSLLGSSNITRYTLFLRKDYVMSFEV